MLLVSSLVFFLIGVLAEKVLVRGDQDLELDSNYWDKLRSDISSPAIKCGARREVNLHQVVFIESPNFGSGKKYPNSVNCKWNFRLNQCTLAITCPNFTLNKFLCFDYLQVTDGKGRAKRYCGTEGPQSLYLEQTAEMTFRTSPSFNAAGFRCFAVCVEPGPVTYTELALPSIPYTSLGHCVCGRRNRPKKFARHEKFPWIGKLVRKNDGEMFCSASLISNKYLISAAHCFSTSMNTKDPRNIQVVLNVIPSKEQGNSSRAPPAFKRNIVQISTYLNLGLELNTDTDIALLKLEKPIELDNDGVVPVCLPKGEDNALHFAGTEAVHSQWSWDSKWNAHRLFNMRSAVITNEDCSSVYRSSSSKISSRASGKSLLCAKNNLPSFCQPISGSALMTMVDSDSGRFAKYTQIGIGTWGNDCSLGDNVPQIYTRITEVVNWILRNTQDSSFCKS